LGIILDYKDKGVLLEYILSKPQAPNILRYLHRQQILAMIIRELADLSVVPQNKGRSKNAFEHTMNVIDATPCDNMQLRWAAMLHDIGKYRSFFQDGHFNHHAVYSTEYAAIACSLYNVQYVGVIDIVNNHMFPLDYQRNPNWTSKAIDTFISRCNGYALDTVEFAIYDKKSENDVEQFVEPLKELYERVKNAIGT
jgi:hypothetical protein